MDYLFTFLWAMTPVGELRLAIPLAMNTYDLPWFGALPVAVVGNLVPALFWLLVLPPLARLITRFPNPIGRLLKWRSEAIRRRNIDRVHRYGSLALVALVAIPLPFTGVWSGCLAAWALEIPFRQSLPPIALGALIAGVLVTALTGLGILIAH